MMMKIICSINIQRLSLETSRMGNNGRVSLQSCKDLISYSSQHNNLDSSPTLSPSNTHTNTHAQTHTIFSINFKVCECSKNYFIILVDIEIDLILMSRTLSNEYHCYLNIDMVYLRLWLLKKSNYLTYHIYSNCKKIWIKGLKIASPWQYQFHVL